MARKTLPSATSLSPISQDLCTGGVVPADQLYADVVLLPMLLPKGKQFTEVARLRIVEETCWLARSRMSQSDYICLWRFNSYFPKWNFNIKASETIPAPSSVILWAVSYLALFKRRRGCHHNSGLHTRVRHRHIGKNNGPRSSHAT